MRVNLGCLLLCLYQLVTVSTVGDHLGGQGCERGQKAATAAFLTPSASSPPSAFFSSDLRAANVRLTSR